MADAVRRRVVVTGRVQGVFFRQATLELARRLGVAGWVTNRADGAVEAVFEGAPTAVGAAVRFCRTGPEAAEVATIDVRDESLEGLRGFDVR